MAHEEGAAPRSFPTPAYLLLNGLLQGLWPAALEVVSPTRGSWVAAGLLYALFSVGVELALRAVAERKVARREGRSAASIRALLARPIELYPLPRPRAYLGQAAWGLAVNALVLFGAAVLVGSRTFPFFTLAFPLLAANALLRPLLVERNPLGYGPGRGLYRPADPR